jgi:hypothetical protein
LPDLSERISFTFPRIIRGSDSVTGANGIFFEKLGRDNMCLLWHLKEILAGLPVRRLFDVGAGVRVSRNICLPEHVESASVVDPDALMLKALAREYDDPRLRTAEVVESGTDKLSGDTLPLDVREE